MTDVRQDLVDFAASVETHITSRLEENDTTGLGAFREQLFTEHVCGYLVEYGAIDDIDLCFFEHQHGRGHCKANAYCVAEDSSKITIVATLYRNEALSTVHRKDIVVALRRALRVFEAARAGIRTSMEPALESYSMMQRLEEASESAVDCDIVVLTNGLAASAIEDAGLPDLGIRITSQVWDMERLFRCAASGRSYEAISIDLSRTATGPIECLKMPESSADYDAYMAIIPGGLLFELYDLYGAKLLELNVRSFLQARGKVNRGIRDTIRAEPHRFLAYNNGISATAESVAIGRTSDGGLQITAVEGFQVVNGGQTMASIHRARKIDQADLSDVFVQAKVTVVPTDRIDDIVPHISRYANTQNRVSEADFSSNDPFHVQIERLSERIWCPGESSRWFYERARGQYQVARARKGTTPARRREFDSMVPTAQKFDKTGLAKYVNAWDQLPYLVSRGNQKNFVHFMSMLKERGDEWLPDEAYFRDLIAKAIIYKRAERIARQHKFPGFQANAVAYTVALLSYRTVGRADLASIWAEQQASEAMADTMYNWMPLVLDCIVNSAGERNVTEWCKKEECWRSVQVAEVEIPDALQQELAEGQPLPTVGSAKGKQGVGLSHVDRENIAKAMQLNGAEWLVVHKWATEKELHFSMAGIALTLSGYATNGWQKVPSAKQAKQAVKMIDLASDDRLFVERTW
ncbi:MAG: AIPR family protein [Phycisphaeraceae bacterium]